MGEDLRTMATSITITRKTWYQFRELCRAHGIPLYSGIEAALRDVLDRNGLSESPYFDESASEVSANF
jgi:hypothetical protein